MKLLKSPSSIILSLAIAVAVLSFLQFNSCNKLKFVEKEAKRKEAIAEQNMRALAGQLHYVRNKAHETEAVKSSFLGDLKTIKKLNEDLYTELKKELGVVKSLIKAQAVIERDSLVISNELTKYSDQSYGLKFRDIYTDSSLTWIISGQSKFRLEHNTIFPGTTTINQNSIRVKMVMGFKENKDNYEVFARSASPLVRFNELDGVIVIPKKPDLTCPPSPRKKRLGLGFSVGYGVTSSASSLTFGSYIGASLNYMRFYF
jgi:hypothetical protein